MYPTRIKMVIAVLAAMALVACGREEASTAKPAGAGKESAKPAANKSDKADAPADGANPMKGGY